MHRQRSITFDLRTQLFQMCGVDLTRIDGIGKVMSGKTERCANRATQALRLAAAALRSSQSALGAYDRRMCARMDLAIAP